ncbi:hypothetical protein EVAR_24289_1 [Eumeta japonica]|uniref:Uncharacterized protein n=1 Tax=Eumeta variegata TaxID=151549 RepID=A0A4C1VFU6_EUMVA|nr:hypothetical protein EVAR_24289_1 [Eumeta japonica]
MSEGAPEDPYRRRYDHVRVRVIVRAPDQGGGTPAWRGRRRRGEGHPRVMEEKRSRICPDQKGHEMFEIASVRRGCLDKSRLLLLGTCSAGDRRQGGRRRRQADDGCGKNKQVTSVEKGIGKRIMSDSYRLKLHSRFLVALFWDLKYACAFIRYPSWLQSFYTKKLFILNCAPP